VNCLTFFLASQRFVLLFGHPLLLLAVTLFAGICWLQSMAEAILESANASAAADIASLASTLTSNISNDPLFDNEIAANGRPILYTTVAEQQNNYLGTEGGCDFVDCSCKFFIGKSGECKSCQHPSSYHRVKASRDDVAERAAIIAKRKQKHFKRALREAREAEQKTLAELEAAKSQPKPTNNYPCEVDDCECKKFDPQLLPALAQLLQQSSPSIPASQQFFIVENADGSFSKIKNENYLEPVIIPQETQPTLEEQYEQQQRDLEAEEQGEQQKEQKEQSQQGSNGTNYSFSDTENLPAHNYKAEESKSSSLIKSLSNSNSREKGPTPVTLSSSAAQSTIPSAFTLKLNVSLTPAQLALRDSQPAANTPAALSSLPISANPPPNPYNPPITNISVFKIDPEAQRIIESLPAVCRRCKHAEYFHTKAAKDKKKNSFRVKLQQKKSSAAPGKQQKSNPVGSKKRK
jgi:hypothetical protein